MHLCSFHPTSSIFIHHVGQAPCQSLQCVSSLTTSRVSCDARNGEGNLQTFSQIWGNRCPRFPKKFIHSVAVWIAWPYHENNLPGKEDGAKGFWGPAGPTLWEPVPCNREFNKTRRWSKLIYDCAQTNKFTKVVHPLELLGDCHGACWLHCDNHPNCVTKEVPSGLVVGTDMVVDYIMVTMRGLFCFSW